MAAAGVAKLEDGGNDQQALNSSFLQFLNDELVLGSEVLDNSTLEAVCQVAQAPGSGGGAQSGHRPVTKRTLEDAALSESDDDDDGGKGDKGSGKRAKGEASSAATKKACREKARREKLNER